MARGELVGDAYIRITADDTLARRDIHRAARTAGNEYTSEFGKAVEDSAERNMAGARQKIADALATGDFSEFERRAGSVDGAVRRLQNALTELRREGKLNSDEFSHFSDVIRRWGSDAVIEERARRDADALKKLTIEVNRAHTEALKMNKVFDAADFDVALRDAALHAARFNDQLRKTSTIQFGEQFTEARVDMQRLRDGLRGVDALVFKTSRSSDDLSSGLRRSRTQGDGLFSIFGGISKTLEGISHRGNPLVDLFVAPLRAGATLGRMFESLFGGQFAKLAAGSKVLGVFGGLATSIGAAVVAMGAAAKVASLLSSALSLVAGMATIAASALGGALVGALLLAAGAVPALVAGLGGVVLFFADFEKQAPKSLDLLKRFGTAFRDAFDREAFRGIDGMITSIVRSLEPLAGPLATALGKSINGIVDTLAKGLSDPRIQASIRAITEAIPRQVSLLGDTLIHLGTGLVGFFAPIMPFVTRMLEAINRTAKSFSDWANSTSGQSKITQFMERVTPMAEALARTFGNVARAIGGIFNAAAEGGTAQKFLDFLEDISDRFADFINSTEGQNKLRGWFDEAYRAGQALGELIAGVARIFGALDTSKSRDQVIKLTDTIGNFLTRHAPDLEKFLGFIDRIGDSVSKINFQPFLDLGREIATFVGEVASAVQGDALTALDTKLQGFNDLAETVRDDLLPAFKDFLVVIKPVVTFLASSSLKGLASSFEGVASLVDGVTEALSGFLNIVTGIFTLDFDKINKGIEQSFEGAGKLAFGAFEAGISGSGIKGIIDKAFGLDSVGTNFDTLRTQVSGFFSSWGADAQTGTDTAKEATGGFFSDLTTKLDTARLAVGQWFDDAFSAPDFSEAGVAIQGFFTTITGFFSTWASDIGTSISGTFQTIVTNIGTFFAQLPANFEGVRLAIGQFFSDLVTVTIPAMLGAAAGSIVNFFYLEAWGVVNTWNNVVIPFFATLPERLGAMLDVAENFFATWFAEAWNGAFAYFETVVVPWFQAIPERLGALVEAAENFFGSWFSDMWNGVFAFFETVVIPWVQNIPERLGAVVEGAENFFGSWFSDMWNGAFAFVESTVIPFFRNLPTMAKNALTGNAAFLVAWFTQAFVNLKSWVSGTFLPFLNNLPAMVQTAFVDIGLRVGGAIAAHLKGIINGIISQMNTFIANFNNFSPFDIPYMRYLARGGMVDEPTLAMMGEGGKRELVVPLDRPLSQIDASVRDLAAIAQGKAAPPGAESVGDSRVLSIAPGAIVVSAPFSDPMLVAEQVLDNIVEEVFA